MHSVTPEDVVAFLSNSIEVDFRQDIEEIFHCNHPRYKALRKMSGRILDIGAGAGGMGQLINWPKPLSGLELVGCDLEMNHALPPGYIDWISGGWESVRPTEKFGGILAIHVIEHLNSWPEMLERSIEVLSEDDLIYIEWPVTESAHWPSASEIWRNFAAKHKEYNYKLLSTFNFYDDDTHADNPPSMENVLKNISMLEILEKGRIFLPGSAKELVSKGLKDQSVSNVTMGIWAEFGFAQYVLAQKKS